MPSHIFIRTGRYAEAADANQRAILGDETYFERAPAPDFYSVYFLHNVHFLAYAAMMEVLPDGYRRGPQDRKADTSGILQ